MSDARDAQKLAEERWNNPNPDNAQHHGRLVKTPTAKELAIFSAARVKSCSTCRRFNLRQGQDLLFRQKGLAEIVHDYQWKVRHLGADPRELGLCESSGALTGGAYPPCDEYRGK